MEAKRGEKGPPALRTTEKKENKDGEEFVTFD